MFSRAARSSYTPREMSNKQVYNKDLAERLEAHFKPKGISAFTNCCGTCTNSYADMTGFEYRKKGIFFFRFSLGGMNYYGEPPGTTAHYDDYNWLLEHWEEESKLIDEFAEIVGVQCTYTKPVPDKAILIEFATPLKLETPQSECESSSSSQSQEEADTPMSQIAAAPVLRASVKKALPRRRKQPQRQVRRSAPYPR